MQILARAVALLFAAGVLVLSADSSIVARAIEGSALNRVEGQQPPPAPPPVTFRLEVNYVEVDATVTDAQGNPVTDLTSRDFEVLEDGRRQAVTAFSLVNLPIERAERPLFAPAPVEPDVQTNTTSEGRVYLIVLDDLHTAFSSTARVRKALRAFIEQSFGVNDRAAVVFTSGVAGAQDFTNSRRLLIEAVEKFAGRKLRPDILEGTGRAGRFDHSAFGQAMDPMEAERAQHARTAMDTIRQVAEFVQGVRGRRKAMLFVSEGIGYDVQDVIRNASASIILQEMRDAIAAATRANVALYAIDPRGLSAFEEAIEVGGLPRAADNAQVSVVRGLQDSLRLAQDSLRVLAGETGGSAVLNRNDFSQAFARIVRENSTYYVLGYYSTNERRDGRFRRLEVRVARPGTQVRARRGYVAPRGRQEPGRAAEADARPLMAAAGEALGSPLPIRGIPMRVFAAAYKGTAPNATTALAVEMDVDSFRFAPKDNTLLDTVAVAWTAIDAAGHTRGGERHVLSLALNPDSAARARERGIRVVGQIDLPPGRYQLRVAAAEEGARRVGSVAYDLTVPDLYGAAFAMSGVTLTSTKEAATPTIRAKDPLGSLLPEPISAARAFEPDDVLTLYAEFYENLRNAPPHALDFSATVRTEDGRVVFQDRQERSSTDLQSGAGGYGYAVRIPLGGLAAGTYLIHVEGRSRAGAASGLGRDMVIRIR